LDRKKNVNEVRNGEEERTSGNEVERTEDGSKVL
jgi:hypothetical protein